MKTTAFSAVTPEGPVAEAAAESVTIPTADGEITVLPEHAPLVSVLVPGVLTIRPAASGKGQAAAEKHLAVSGGFVHVTAGSVTVLADTAERADDIDVRRAEAGRKRAEEAMAKKLEREEMAETSAVLQKNLARLRAVELIKRHRPSRKREV